MTQQMAEQTAAPLDEVGTLGSDRLRWLVDHPQVVLMGVLVVLVAATGAIQPGYLSVNGVRNTLLIAAPLAIIAGGQTVAMLTGGIDLSVAITATGAAYVAGSLSSEGAAVAILGGLVAYNLVIWALVAVLLIFGLSRTGLGRMVYAVGDNPVACRLAGVRVWQVLLVTYVLCSILAAVRGVLYVGVIHAA